MAQSFDRMDQIAQEMHRKLAGLIQAEVRDPRIGLVTLSRIVVSRDLAHATVYITTLSEEAKARLDSVNALNRAAGFLRTRLAKSSTLRGVPRLIFREDVALQASQRVHSLMTKVALQRQES